MLINIGSQISLLRSAWIRKHRESLRQLQILPVTNVNITTAAKRRGNVMHQAYVNFKCNDLELGNQLICDGIIGMYLLSEINAQILVIKQTRYVYMRAYNMSYS